MGALTCSCTRSDAWRCAIASRSSYVACPCRCHHGMFRGREYTEEPAGPLSLLVMALGKELHDKEHGAPEESDCGGDWFAHVGSTVSSFCRRAVEARGLDWEWVRAAGVRESTAPETEMR